MGCEKKRVRGMKIFDKNITPSNMAGLKSNGNFLAKLTPVFYIGRDRRYNVPKKKNACFH